MESHPGDTLGTRFLTFWGAIGAFFGFAVFAILLQKCSSGVAKDPRDTVRATNLVEVREAGSGALEKLGWGADDTDALKSAVSLANARKQSETKVVVPGSETANRLAAEAEAAATTLPTESADGADGSEKDGGENDGGANPGSVEPVPAPATGEGSASEPQPEKSDSAPPATPPSSTEPTQS